MLGAGECGVFEINPNTGIFRTLRSGVFPDCGGAAGPVSPDGIRVLHTVEANAGRLTVLNLQTSEIHGVGGTMTSASWSPDGRWIAAIKGKSRISSIVLFDAADTSRERILGRTMGGRLDWSPDSKYLLVAKPEAMCGPDLWSLEVIEVETGKRTDVKSAHCEIFETNTGWMDLNSVGRSQ